MTGRCPKCGELNPSATHHRFCFGLGWPWKNTRPSEHLHLACHYCGYDWVRDVKSS